MKPTIYALILSIGLSASITKAEFYDEGSGQSGMGYSRNSGQTAKGTLNQCETTNPLGCSPSVQTLQNAFVALVISNRFDDAIGELSFDQTRPGAIYGAYFKKINDLRDAVLAAHKKKANVEALRAIVSRVDLNNLTEASQRTNAVIWPDESSSS